MPKIILTRDDFGHVIFEGAIFASNGAIKFTGLFILLSLELSMSLHFCQEKISRLCVDLGTKSFQSFRTFLNLTWFRTRKTPRTFNILKSKNGSFNGWFRISIENNLTNGLRRGDNSLANVIFRSKIVIWRNYGD